MKVDWAARRRIRGTSSCATNPAASSRRRTVRAEQPFRVARASTDVPPSWPPASCLRHRFQKRPRLRPRQPRPRPWQLARRASAPSTHAINPRSEPATPRVSRPYTSSSPSTPSPSSTTEASLSDLRHVSVHPRPGRRNAGALPLPATAPVRPALHRPPVQIGTRGDLSLLRHDTPRDHGHGITREAGGNTHPSTRPAAATPNSSPMLGRIEHRTDLAPC